MSEQRSQVRYVEFVVDKLVLAQIFSRYIGFPLPILIPLIARLSSEAGTLGPVLAGVSCGLRPTPTNELKGKELRRSYFIIHITLQNLH
jgi:hypothetical protein